MSKLSQDECEYDDLARRLAGEGISGDELARLHGLQTRIIKARRRWRPLLAVVGWVFWFVQRRINNPLIKRISKSASYWLWDRIISPVVNDWIGKVRAADAAAAAPHSYHSASCATCGEAHGRFPIGSGDPMRFRLVCNSCGPRFMMQGLIARNVQ